MIDKPILKLLTFGSNMDFVDFVLKKLNFQAVIKSAASAASLDLQGESQDDGFGWRATASGLSPSNQGGCASSRLDHGLKV